MDCKLAAISNDYADVVLDFQIGDAMFEQPVSDYCVQRIDSQVRVYYIDRATIPGISVTDYQYTYLPKCYGQMQDVGEVTSTLYVDRALLGDFDPNALQAAGILSVQRNPLLLTGRGCVIALLDDGIDYRSQVFRNADGSTRILSIWDQTIQTGSVPEGFFYGSEYTREDINRALASENPAEVVPTADSEGGHGSIMASIAAGSRINEGISFVGAAPDADLVVVKLKQAKQYLRDYYFIPEGVTCYAESDILLALKYVQQFCITFQRPLVICLGFGTNQGEHSGTAILDSYLNRLGERRSIAVVTPSGNEGNAAHHYRGEIIGEDRKSVEIRVEEGAIGFVLEIWGSIPSYFNIGIRSPGGEEIGRINGRVNQSVTYRLVYEKTEITADTLVVEQSSGEEVVVLRFSTPTPGIWTINVTAEPIYVNTVFNMWLPISQFLNQRVYFLEPTVDTTLTPPSTSASPITVSAYDDVTGGIWLESGRGYTRRGVIKPELAAPGVNVSSIRGKVTGTSVASAVTAGGVAQFMQWAVVERNQPLVDGVDVKNYLIRGADRSRNIYYPNREFGYGYLDIKGAFDALTIIP